MTDLALNGRKHYKLRIVKIDNGFDFAIAAIRIRAIIWSKSHKKKSPIARVAKRNACETAGDGKYCNGK